MPETKREDFIRRVRARIAELEQQDELTGADQLELSALNDTDKFLRLMRVSDPRTTKYPMVGEGRYAVSPEESANWWCLKCLNKTRFVGVDHRGYGGPASCV